MTHDELVASGLHECASDCPPPRGIPQRLSDPQATASAHPRAALAEALGALLPPMEPEPYWLILDRLLADLAERGVLLVWIEYDEADDDEHRVGYIVDADGKTIGRLLDD